MIDPLALARPVIAGNWKMYKGPADAAAFVADFTAAIPGADHPTLILFPPAISLPAVADALRTRTDIFLGVQNVHWEKSGAFTGEISADMAREAGARFALAGHSERRHIFGETDEQVAMKAAAAIDAQLVPVVCVGETLEERRAGKVEDVLRRQLAPVLDRLGERVASILVAYEPVWAIGTGVNATPDDASTAHAFLRALLRTSIGDRADRLPILYGGSVKPGNAAELLAAPDVNGVLVGGASLDPGHFAAIAAAE